MTGNSSLSEASTWLETVLAGPLVIAICSIAIAVMGVSMFAGRFGLRRGVIVIFGCFVVLGASTIANALVNLPTTSAAIAEASTPPPPRLELPSKNDRKADDPYAGASLAH